MTTTTITPTQKMHLKPIRPMPFMESLLLFGIPAALLFASLWWLMPLLEGFGVSNHIAYSFSLTLINVGLLTAAVVGYFAEGNPLSWLGFAKRMRLSKMTGRIWLWTIGGTLLFGGLALLINAGATILYDAIGYKMPVFEVGVMSFGLNAVVLFFNIVGEEIWWRGYIMPRQELTHGEYTWLIHGVLWACFHMFKWWAVPFMLITCQIIPFIAQKTKNTWPGMINHIIINAAGVIMSAM